jgi:hypothetical protein
LCYYFGLFWVCSHSSGNYVGMARVKLLEALNWQNAVIAWIWRLCVFHVCVLSSALISCCLSHVICISSDVSYHSWRFCVDSLGSTLLILANCLMFSPCTECLSWWKLDGIETQMLVHWTANESDSKSVSPVIFVIFCNKSYFMHSHLLEL